jgi:3-hydroxypropanoate dehydrogenase
MKLNAMGVEDPVLTDGAIGEAALDQLFLAARTRNAWLDKPVSDELVRQVYDLAKWGPTAANSNPARFLFVRSPAAKERLLPHINPGNVEKVRTAPCTVIVAGDMQFYDLMPQLFPSRDMRTMFLGEEKRALVADLVQRNSTLQGAYLMIAARALGLDCGPMSGFNKTTLDAEYFPDGRWQSNFLFAMGYGSELNLFERNPRLSFDEACLDL